MKNKIWRVIVLMSLIGMGMACSFEDEPNPTLNYLPLPPPAYRELPAQYSLQKTGERQVMEFSSPFITVDYNESKFGSISSASEEALYKPDGSTGTMLQTDWGDWQLGRVRIVEYYDGGVLTEGLVEYTVSGSTIFQLGHGMLNYTVDRSKLYIRYIKGGDGTLKRESAWYVEEWGSSNEDIFAMGIVAVWDRNTLSIPMENDTWGFWESSKTPFEQVTKMLEQAKTQLRKASPNLLMVDEDSSREIAGQQTGFQVYRDGKPVGKITFTYDNGWGRMPNSPLKVFGGLSRVEWNVNGEYYTLLILTPRWSPIPSSLFVFASNKEVADQIYRDQANWPQLYARLREGIEGVQFAVHAFGDVGDQTDTVCTDDGCGTVKIGEGGAIQYGFVTKPSTETLQVALEHLATLGVGGQKALDLYYARGTQKGTGLVYYLTMSMLVLAPERFSAPTIAILDEPGLPPADMWK